METYHAIINSSVTFKIIQKQQIHSYELSLQQGQEFFQ